MISKIHNIRGVGRFKDFISKPGIEFDKLTLIYSENGQGKSTLADIFRSLAEDDAARLKGRETVGGPDQFVKLEVNGNDVCFHEGKWTQSLDDIFVFDEIFVNENVYQGLSVDVGHRRNLLPVIIGDTQKAGVKKEEKLIEDRDSLNSGLADLKRCIESVIRGVDNNLESKLTLDQFLQLDPVEDIDDQIASQKAVVDQLHDRHRILNEKKFEYMELPVIPKEELAQLLEKTLAGVADNARKTLEDHINAFSGDDMENWIKTGTRYKNETDNICPYCGQSLSGSDLIKHYQAIFEEAYEEFDNELSTFSSRYLNFERSISNVKVAVETNPARGTFWAEHIPDLHIPQLDSDLVEQRLTHVKAEMESLLRVKQSALFKPVQISPDLEAGYSGWNEVVKTVENYNSETKEVNNSIDELREGTETGDIAEEEQKLLRLRYSKLRYRSDVDSDCNEYKSVQNDLEDTKRRLSEQQNANSIAIKNVFDKYSASLNNYLQAFGAGFSIVNLKQTRIGKQLRADYMIQLSGKEIKLGDEKTPISERSFRNVLSEGDKRTLALAFFLTKLDQLDQMDDLSNKIIVLDDPVTSMDDNRRLNTVEKIGSIANKVKQIIVLSHRPEFLHDIWDSFGNATKDMVPSRRVEIQFQEGDTDASEFKKNWDSQATVRSIHAENIQRVLYFIKGTHGYKPDDMVWRLRKILETHFKTNYPDIFPGNKTLGYFLGCIAKAEADSPLFPMKGDIADEIQRLKDLLSSFIHAGDSPRSISRNELVPICDRVLAVVGRPKNRPPSAS